MIDFENIDFNDKKGKQIVSVVYDWDSHSKGILTIAKGLIGSYEINDNNKQILSLLLMYFTGDDRFCDSLKKLTETDGSLDKGLMLVGGVGTGKSLLFDIFHKYTRDAIRVNSFQKYSAMDIVDTVNVSGVGYMELFNHNIVDKIARPIRCYIDDIASKNENIKHFGTELSVIEQLLSIRYNVFERYGTLTHVSSNKYPMEMLEMYDSRIVDRMKTMFNIIPLEGNSFRK